LRGAQRRGQHAAAVAHLTGAGLAAPTKGGMPRTARSRLSACALGAKHAATGAVPVGGLKRPHQREARRGKLAQDPSGESSRARLCDETQKRSKFCGGGGRIRGKDGAGIGTGKTGRGVRQGMERGMERGLGQGN